MKLSDKKMQELKNRKFKIEDLYEKYFYTDEFGVNTDAISKLLNNNICDFKQIVDKYGKIKSCI